MKLNPIKEKRIIPID